MKRWESFRHKHARELIESLEPRRMLASFSGTDGVDSIQVFTVGSEIHVVINGVEHSTEDQTVTVSGGGGNDTVVLGAMNIHSPRILSIQLGAGDDTVTTHDFTTGIGSLDGIDGGVSVNGGPGGNDSFLIDDSDGVGTIEYAFEDNSFRFGDNFIHYGDFESCSLDQNARPSTRTFLISKAPALDLTVSGRDGRDEFYAISGKWDEHGWTVDTANVFGGAGNDSIEFNDRVDQPGALPLNIAGFTISRGTAGFTYSAIESQSISQLGSPQFNVINMNGPSGFIESTSIRGQNTTLNLNGVHGNTTVIGVGLVNVGGASLAGVSGTINIDQSAVGAGTINVNDQIDTGNDNYTVTATQLTKTVGPTTQVTVNYVRVGTLRLNANEDGNNINVHGTPADPNFDLIVNAGGGSDSIALGNGNIAANLLSSVFVNGGAGSNSIHFNNSQDTSPSTQTLNGTAFTDGQSHEVTLVSSIFIENGTGGGTLNMDRVAVFTHADSISANQIVNIGAGNLDANLLADCSVGRATTVNVDDSLDTGNDGYIIENQLFRKTTFGARSVGVGTGASILHANHGNNTFQVQINQFNTDVRLNGNGGNDQFIVTDTAVGLPFSTFMQTVSIDTGTEQASAVEPFGDYITINSDVGTANDVGARVKLLSSDAIRRLTVKDFGTFQVPTDVVAQLGELLIPGGAIDLAGGALLNKPGGPTQATLKTLITRGYNNGAWDGIHAQGSINSSLAATSNPNDAIGHGLGSEIAPTSIGPFAIDPADTLVRYTYYGDADLNGAVNFDDYSRTDNGFINNRTGWVNGDFNYDNAINFDDYALIDLAFNTQGSPFVLATGRNHGILR